MPKHHIVLSENDIEKLINGEEIHVEFKQPINVGENIIVRQSYVKDASMPLINRDKKVFSKSEINNIKISSAMMADTFKFGV